MAQDVINESMVQAFQPGVVRAPFMVQPFTPGIYAIDLGVAAINDANKAAFTFTIRGGRPGDTYNYTLSSAGGGTPVSSSGDLSTDPLVLSNINATGLTDGLCTLSVYVTDRDGKVSDTMTATLTKDVVAPSGYTVAITTDPIDENNDDAFAFQFADAVVGTTYNYSIDSDGGSADPVTGTGTIATATDTVEDIDVSSLEDGTLTLSVTLTDPSGNTGSAATDTVEKSTA